MVEEVKDWALTGMTSWMGRCWMPALWSSAIEAAIGRKGKAIGTGVDCAVLEANAVETLRIL